MLFDLDYLLAPANLHELPVGTAVLAERRDLLVLGDKADYCAEVAATRHAEVGITLFALPRANQRAQVSPAVVALHTRCRQITETINGQLSKQFHTEDYHAKTFWGLCARRYSKLTAPTLCLHLNRLLDRPDCWPIKALAFAN